jgi:hypothetical protein
MPHTSGPWVVSSFLSDSNAIMICTPDEEVIATAWNLRKKDGTYPLTDNEANALLIAAAPDLLMALETLMIDLGEGNAHGRGLDMIQRATEKAARVAISKAKGTS